jgi:4-hydroxy-4-methyl-2-oxoglutarate aldolase
MTQPDAVGLSTLPRLEKTILDLLVGLATCDLANAIEVTGVRLRNEGYMDSTVRCLFPEFAPLMGYALTLRVRTGDPPIAGPAYVERADWWDQFLAIPEPRLLVVKAEPDDSGSGSILGEVHAHIYRGLGCVGLVTDGAVRDLPALRRLGFPVFAGHVSVSHAYAHVVEVGIPVVVGGLEVRTGDLIHGDGHGVLSVPLQVAHELPAIAARQKKQDQAIIEYCRSTAFTVDGLKRLLDGNQK